MTTNQNQIDHIDVVTCHKCNKLCENCIDKFLMTTKEEITVEILENYLEKLKKITTGKTVLFLGGEPTVCGAEKLIKMAQVVWCKGFVPSISTNGLAEKTIKKIISFFNWVQITIENQSDVDKFQNNREKINLKLGGDSSLTMDKFLWFCKESKKFGRGSLSMYFTPDFRELCSDVEIWKLLDSLEWKKAGSYLYAFYDGVRIKRCIKGVTNIADEPQIPKLYPNGNYNKTWTNEDLDDYLHLFS